MKKVSIDHEPQAFEVMTSPVQSVQTNDSIQTVAHLFSENNIGAAVVVDSNKKPVGVVTKTDLIRYEEKNDDTKTIPTKNIRITDGESQPSGFHIIGDEESVENWMTPVIFSVKPNTPLQEIARKMVQYGIHHIFVRSEHSDAIAGIVSSFDILRQVAAGTKTVE